MQCKLQPYCVKLFVLLSQLFERITLVKPVTSRPASGERYIVALCLRDISETTRRDIIEKLWTVADDLAHHTSPSIENNIATASAAVGSAAASVSTGFNGKEGDRKREEQEEEEEEQLEINWPFHVPSELVHAAVEYLTTVNDSHLLSRVGINMSSVRTDTDTTASLIIPITTFVFTLRDARMTPY
jgi:hypothetical protein